ncbi:MAG: tetratricopeptide repeat protein, partial [Myxococcota bacterium]
MDPVALAPQLLAGLFVDGGAKFLAEAGLPSPWELALGPTPIPVLALPPGPELGWRQLASLREFWAARGPLSAAVAATRALHHHRASTAGRDHPDAWLEQAALGSLLQRAGAAREGAALLDQAWAALRSTAGGRDLRVAIVAQNVAAARFREGRLADAEHALEIALRIRRELAPATTALVAAQLGEVRMHLGRPADAVDLLQEAASATAAAEGADSPRALARAQMWGTVLNQLGRYPQVVEVLRPVAAAARDDEVRASVAFELGLALDRTGHREEGLRRIDEALRITRALGQGGVDHPALANRVVQMAQLHLERERLDEAEGLLREAVDITRRASGDSSPEVAERYVGLGQFLARFG